MGLSLSSLLGGGNTGQNPGGDWARQAALDEFKKLQTPDIDKMRVELEQLVQTGQLRPEEAQVYLQKASEMSGAVADPTARAAQFEALSGLQDIGNQGGMTDIDRARMREISDTMATENRGAQEAITQNAQERGVYGGGVEMASRMLAEQAAATRASNEGVNVNAEAQRRALEAIMQSGQLGGQIAGQTFGESSERAQAQDAIERFNTQNRQDVMEQNLAARNEAARANLAEKQRVSDTNVASENANRTRNADLVQQDFNNRLQKTSGIAGQYGEMAASGDASRAAEEEKKNRRNQMLGNLISSGAMVGAAAINPAAVAPKVAATVAARARPAAPADEWMDTGAPKPAARRMTTYSDERLKENVEDGKIDLDEFFGSLPAAKFDYKDPKKHGAGKHYSTMAQDLEKNPVGKSFVVEGPDGKMIHGGKAIGVILAQVANLTRKVNEGART